MSKHIIKKKVMLKDDVKLSKHQKSQVKQIVKGVQQIKYFNTSAAAQLVDWAGAVVRLSSLTQGNGDTQRNGDTVKCTSLQMSYSIVNPSPGTIPLALSQLVRVIIFRWLPLDSTPPILGDIMNTTGAAVSVLSQYNDDKREQFEVLYDKLHSLNSVQSGFGGVSSVFSHYVKCNKKIEYLTGTSNGTSNIYMLYVSDQNPTAGAERAQMSYYHTLRYTNS